MLSSGAHGSGGGHSGNQSDSALDLCGANFCVVETIDNANLERPPDSEIFEISAIYLTCIVVAVLIIALFMDPLSRYGERRRGSITAQEISGIELLSATFKQLKKVRKSSTSWPYAFLSETCSPAKSTTADPADSFHRHGTSFHWRRLHSGKKNCVSTNSKIYDFFVQAYVSCALGIHQIGYVMICFGVVNAICSVIFGSLMKYIGRFSIITFGTVVHMGIFSYLLFWRPHPDSPLIFFLISGLWGVGKVFKIIFSLKMFENRIFKVTRCGKLKSTVFTAHFSEETRKPPSRTTDSGNLSDSWSLTLTALRYARAWSCTLSCQSWALVPSATSL